MRRFFLILMIALLPLRGWVGEAMAMEMLAQQSNAIQNIASSAEDTSASSHFYVEMQADHAPCPGHAESAEHATDGSTSHCGTCPLCQMCHTVAAPAPWALPSPLWLGHAQPATGHARFASAPAAFALKPPIS
ncbi:MAG: DUF2946 family protein [Rhodoferax sp.]|uniref:DUF2946 family protein n=1 Tax=Rhodoferax sp. TaxID=50421 RepID=UPI003264EB29